MRLSRHIKSIETLIGSLPYVASSSITFDERPANVACVKGAITFLDGSELHFMEFLFEEGEVVFKEKYSYHYMKLGKMVFRYDNALDPKARPLPTYPHHKHRGRKILPSKPPTLKAVLEEVESCL
jgi:hypothetical protein